MEVNIICVGKLKESYWREACAEYAKRLAVHCRFNIHELAEYRLNQEHSPAERTKALKDEGRRILEKCRADSIVIALCVEGETISSERLAAGIASAALNGKSTVNFIIGGSYGLSDEVKGRSDLRVSMGRMTFPHQLARVMLCEQIYRAFAINSGSQYHK